ncbi:hypothetical protein FYF33_20210 [Salmonella enterica]|nr:hypothetical protein [Salmonella enterica]
MNKSIIKQYLKPRGDSKIEENIVNTSIELFNRNPFKPAMKGYSHYRTSDIVDLIDRACVNLGYEKQTKNPA